MNLLLHHTKSDTYIISIQIAEVHLYQNHCSESPQCSSFVLFDYLFIFWWGITDDAMIFWSSCLELS